MYRSYKKSFASEGDLRKCSKEKKFAWNNKNMSELKTDKKRFSNLSYLFKHYMTHSSMHGLRYIIDPELYSIERVFWLIFFVISISYTVHVISTVSTEFRSAPTRVVIESTSFKVSNLPFPSVTICPRDRVDWKKVLKIEKDLFPSNDFDSIKIFRKLLTTLSSLSFARFNEVSFLKSEPLIGFDHINITDVLLKVAPSCKDIFSSCWWRYENKSCCEIFHVQKTEHGFCYAFNSATSENWGLSSKRLLRTPGYGTRSGLKVTLHLDKITPPPSRTKNDIEEIKKASVLTEHQEVEDLIHGAILFVQRPNYWSSWGQTIASGMSYSVNVKCNSGYATTDVLNLSPDKIPCKYSKEEGYTQQNCVSDCRRNHVKKYCGCVPSYFFQSGHTRECKVQDFLCLMKYNGSDVFLTYHSSEDNNPSDFHKPKDFVMTCNCPPQCDFFSYETNMVPIPITKENDIILDVHFDGPTSLRYRMEVVFTSQNLLVSLGGIFGLFLGGSVLSVAEFIYTCFVGIFGGLYLFLRSKKNTIKEDFSTQSGSEIYCIGRAKSDIQRGKHINIPRVYIE